MSAGIPGSGAGIGASSPSVFELETRAEVFLTRTNLGISQDSLDIPINDMDRPRMWKYTSEAQNPFIMPLNRLRISMKASENQVSDVWTKAFQKLSEMLTEDSRQALLREIRLPPELRDPAFGSLDKVLGWMASTIAWVETNPAVTHAQEVNKTYEMNYAQIVATRPGVGAQNTLEIAVGSRDFLNQVGHADPYFDLLTGYVNHLEEYASELKGG